MYTEYYIDQLAETMVELWGKIEIELIEDIARRIKKTGRITDTAEFELEKLEQANLLNSHAVQLISQITGISDSTIEQLLTSSSYQILRTDELIYRYALETGQLTLEPLPIEMSPRLKTAIDSCVKNAKFGLSNLTNTRMTSAGNNKETLTQAAVREYYNAANRVFLEVRTGIKSTDEAVKEACTELADKGIQVTSWDSGHKDTVEIAVRRNVRTSMAQTHAEMTLARMGDYQSDLVQVSSHFGARPSHAVWQGGIYSLTGNGYPDFYEVTGYGTGPGLCGWNCRHRFYPYFEGMPIVYPKYDEEENRNQYEDTQRQRAYERNIRKAKKTKAAAEGRGASEDEIKQCNAKIRQEQKKLREFLAEHPNLQRNRGREQVYDADGTIKA